MGIAKIIEVSATGDSVEAAVQAAVEGAAKTVQDIQQVYVRDIVADVKDDKIACYRVHAKITFLVHREGA